ncbi:MAG TPA: glycosyltransferase, partial [Microbacteriaceae bacterium]|nr:glycosyltransferase [Microbacteriaceae bacterium]
MPTTVTAVVVYPGGGDLERTLAALAGQTRRPDRVVVVKTSSRLPQPPERLAEGVNAVVTAHENATFGAAVAAGLAERADLPAEDEFYWLLDHDVFPDGRALAALLAAMEASPSVGVAGPKLVDADDPERLRGLGETLTSLGASVTLMTGGPTGLDGVGVGSDYAAGELDQGQHDHISDVLGVSARGMLVRAGLWRRVDGFDVALEAADDGLDLCVRARLCRYRVVVVPEARVAVAAAGRKRAWHRSRQRHRRYRRRRRAQLHRRLVYAPALALPLHWLSLPPLGLVRILLWLVCKRPGLVFPEIAATLRVFFSWRAVGRARRTLRRERDVGFRVIAPLRLHLGDARRMRALARAAGRRRDAADDEEALFTEAGFWAIIAAALAGVILALPILGRASLAGGGILPLGSFHALWSAAAHGLRPYDFVLAVLGTPVFWQPSLAFAALWVAALPLAALGAWFAATTLTRRAGLRAAIALAWAFAPPLLAALYDGRSGALVFHLLLPWIVVAAAHIPRSWSAVGTAALLVAAALAAAPSAWPLFAAAWLVGLAVAGRSLGRALALPLPALCLFAPAAWRAWPNLPALFADPGVPVVGSPGAPWQVLLGLPPAAAARLALLVHDVTPAAWGQLSLPMIVAALLFAVPALIALAATFLSHAGRAGLWLGLALAGMVVALVVGHVPSGFVGEQPVTIAPGPALSVAWLGILAAGVTGLDVLAAWAAARRVRRHPTTRRRDASVGIGVLTWAALCSVALASLPVAIALTAGHGQVAAATRSALPAVVTAQASTNPQVGTLRLTAQPGGGLGATVARGAGQSLAGLAQAGADPGLARLVGDLATRGHAGTSAGLKGRGIGFVLVMAPARAPGAGVTAAARATRSRVLGALDADATLQRVQAAGGERLYSVAG